MTEMVAFIHPSDMYCSLRAIPDDTVLDWETAPRKELEAEGFRPCRICYGGDVDGQ